MPGGPGGEARQSKARVFSCKDFSSFLSILALAYVVCNPAPDGGSGLRASEFNSM
jgi:hypothetical protein